MVVSKIGILTYFWSDNPGTFLQAYSTVQSVQQRFPDSRVDLVNVRHRKAGFHISKRDINPYWMLKDYRRYAGYRRAQRQHMAISSEQLVTTDYGLAGEFLKRQGYDLIIVGADTCLEPLAAHYQTGQIPIYWLPPGLDCRKVMFSSSVNAASYDGLDERMRDRMRASIEKFDLVGVRDDATWNLMNALGLQGSAKLEITPDPTLVFEIDYAPIEALARGEGYDLSRPAIGLLNATARIGSRIADFYRAKGFQVVSLSCDSFADWRPWAIDPFEWAGAFRSFSVTVTESFHAAIFSLKNLRPVVVLELETARRTREGLSKRLSLLMQFGMDANHLDIRQSKDFDKVISTAEAARATFDPQAVRRHLDRLRDAYLGFLGRIVQLMT